MIFLTVGTWRAGYDRLMRAVDELVSSGVITEEVIAQIGYSSYKPKYLTTFEFCTPEDFRGLISSAKLVISHAGIGTIMEVVKQAKPLVVVPRKLALGEVDNDHQLLTAEQLEKEGKILVAYEVNELPGKLKAAETFVPVQGRGSKEILRVVQEFIDDLIARRGC